MVMANIFDSPTDDSDRDKPQEVAQAFSPTPVAPSSTPQQSASLGWGLSGFGQPAPSSAAQQAASTVVQQQAAAQPSATDLSGPGSLGERVQNFIQSNGGPDSMARTGWQDFNYGLGAPGRAVSQIPYFDQQPKILQGAEQATANALPYALLGPEGFVGKAATAGAIGVSQDVDQLVQQANPGIPFTSLNYNSLVTPFGGPAAIASNLLAGKVGGAVGDRFGASVPEVAPELPAAPQPVAPEAPRPVGPTVAPPVAPQSPPSTSGLGAVFAMAPNGVTDSFVDSMWNRAQAGERIPFGDGRAALETRIQQAIDAGQVSSRDDIARIVQGGSAPTVAPPEPAAVGTPTYPASPIFQNADHQAGFYQGALDRQEHPEWRDIPPEFQSRGGGDSDFTQGRKEGFMGFQPGTLMTPGGAGQLSMDEAMQGIGPQSPTPNPQQVQQAIQVQSAAQDAWMQQPGSNPFQPPRGVAAAAADVPPEYDASLWRNSMAVLGAPTQFLMVGSHMARSIPGEALRPTVAGNGINAFFQTMARGPEAGAAVIEHVNRDFGPYVPEGARVPDMQAKFGSPPLNQTLVQHAIDNVPVVGPLLGRFRQANSNTLTALRDAHYLTEADRLYRTVGNITDEMLHDQWREANNATMHTTLLKGVGSDVSTGMGIGVGPLIARAQEAGNLVWGSGAPLPFVAAGSRPAAFKTIMGVGGTMLASTILAHQLGTDVNLSNPFSQFGVDSTFLKPVTNNGLAKTVYGTGGAGYDTLFKGAANIGYHLFNGDEKAALDSALAFARGEFGVVPAAVIDGILGQDWKGSPYSWQDFINEAKTAFMSDQHGNLGQGRGVPIAAGENLSAIKAYGPEGVLRALPADVASSVQTSPLTSGGQAFKYAAPPDIMAKAFPSSPLLQQALNGKDWSELLPNEKKDITTTLGQSNPQLAQQIQDQSRATSPASAAHGDAITALQDRKASAENYLLDQYNAGKMNAATVKNAFHVVETDYYNSKAKADADPAYQAELAKFKSSGTDPSAAQKYVDAYYQISQHYAADKAERQSQEAKYIQWVQSQDPQMAVRLVAAIQPKNQTELEKMYYSGALNGVR